MRIIQSIVLVLTALMAIWAAPVTAQTDNNEIVLKASSEPLASVFKQLEQQTTYKVMYVTEDVKNCQTTLDIRTRSIDEAMTAIIGQHPLDFSISNQFITVIRQNRNDIHLRYAYNAYNYSDARIAKGDFIRLKEVSVGYDFPKSLISTLHLSNLSLKLQATNLFLIYADKKLNGQDPEFTNSGGVAVPMPKQFTLTLRLGL